GYIFYDRELAAAGPLARSALPALREHLLEHHQVNAIIDVDTPGTFVRIGGPAAVEELLRLIPSASAHDRTRLARALGKAGPAAGPALRKLAEDADAATRAGAVTALGTLAGADANFIGPIVAALKDANLAVRQAAVAELRQIGRPAASARPALVEL